MTTGKFVDEPGAEPWWARREIGRGPGPLHAALKRRDAEGAKEALEADWRALRERSPGGETALHLVARWESPSVVSMLVEAGLEVDARDFKGRTALHDACSCGNVDVARRLLELGADPSAQMDGGCSALAAAARNFRKREGDEGSEWRETAELLLEAGADIDAPDQNGLGPAHWAAIMENLAVLAVLAERGADLTARSSNGRTPLEEAVYEESAASAEWLARWAAEKEAQEIDEALPAGRKGRGPGL